jgi:3',5'-cyclic-nucleotide phosphodiesterase
MGRRTNAWRAAAAMVGSLFACQLVNAQPLPAFDVLVLGATGGIQAVDLSHFLVRLADQARGVTRDAGSLVNGIRVADERGAFAEVLPPVCRRQSRIGHVFTDGIQRHLCCQPQAGGLKGL